MVGNEGTCMHVTKHTPTVSMAGKEETTHLAFKAYLCGNMME